MFLLFSSFSSREDKKQKPSWVLEASLGKMISVASVYIISAFFFLLSSYAHSKWNIKRRHRQRRSEGSAIHTTRWNWKSLNQAPDISFDAILRGAQNWRIDMIFFVFNVYYNGFYNSYTRAISLHVRLFLFVWLFARSACEWWPKRVFISHNNTF